ncbi:MAG: acyl-[ACP]--phospholipid O-acyltransferase, partial [Campylobacteraceae bacterium]
MSQLLRIKGFLPFLIIMFMNASVDLAHKITIQNVLIKSYDGNTLIILSAVINAMILLPFIFLFSPSGYLNDKYSKTTVVRYATLVGIALSFLVLISYIQGWFIFAFLMTFLLAIQSAIYSPAKYGLIKNLVGVEKLSLANGVVQALTIIAILLSSLLFSIIFEKFYLSSATSPKEILPLMVPIGFVLVCFSLIEAFFAFKLPFFKAKESDETFDMKSYLKLQYLRKNLKMVVNNRDIWLSIIGLSIFWGVSQMVIAAFPAHYKMLSGSDNTIVIQAILAVSAIGLVCGSILAGTYSRKHIELGIIPIGALGMFVALLGIAFNSNVVILGICSMMFGFFGGLLIVPLNSIIQYFSSENDIGKMLAGNNFVQNCTMVTFLFLTVVVVQILGLSTTQLFVITGFITFIGAIFAIKQVPHLFARILLFPILKIGYKMNISGIENIPPRGGALLLGNHISWIDWLILQVASPRALKFVMYRGIYDKWYLTWIFKFFDVIPIAGGASKSAIEAIRDRLERGQVVALFPEGVISFNGQIGKFERGFELAMEGVDVPIIPFYLRGLWGSTFSRADDYYKQLRKNNGKREIMVTFGNVMSSTSKTTDVKKAVVELSYSAWDFFISRQEPLHYMWLSRASSHPFKPSIYDTNSNTELNNLKVLTSVILFIKALKKPLELDKNVGILLPSSAATAISNLTLMALGKKPVNLNYTVSLENMKSAIEQADIKHIITSKAFLTKLDARGFNFSEALEGKIIFAEDIRESFSKPMMVRAMLQAFLLPASLIELLYFEVSRLDDVATILFSSGSESKPKGVELTHKNLLANIKQISDLLNFRKDDVILNSLPSFHSFGLTVTTLMPLSEGLFSVAVADPTDTTTMGKVCYKHRVSILLGTSTFFRLYIKNNKLHPLMFQNVRIAVAGAEKLRDDVRQGFRAKFGIELYEGYGTTETAPVVAVNMPDALEPDTYKPLIFHKDGTVGMALPGTLVRIVDPDTLEDLPVGEDGLILIGGSQVMKGYLNNPEKTEEVIVEIEGWRYYKSGDKGHIDDDGFITIVDRYSRFAKIGGEMISLGSIENFIVVLFKDEMDL